MNRRTILGGVVALTAGLGLAGGALAQEVWPGKPIRFDLYKKI